MVDLFNWNLVSIDLALKLVIQGLTDAEMLAQFTTSSDVGARPVTKPAKAADACLAGLGGLTQNVTNSSLSLNPKSQILI